MKWNSLLYDSKHDFVSEYGEDLLEFIPKNVLVKQNCNTSVQNFSEKFRIYSTVSLTMSL